MTDRLPSILADVPGISLVYLFGSRVSGRIGPMSDYDAAIFVDIEQDSLSIQTRFQYEVSKLLGTERVDIVILNRAPIELAYAVIAHGKLLYQRDLGTRVEFEAQVLGKYFDYLPVLQYFQKHTLQGDSDGKRVQRYREALRRTQRTLGKARTPSRSSSR